MKTKVKDHKARHMVYNAAQKKKPFPVLWARESYRDIVPVTHYNYHLLSSVLVHITIHPERSQSFFSEHHGPCKQSKTRAISGGLRRPPGPHIHIHTNTNIPDAALQSLGLPSNLDHYILPSILGQ